MRFTVYRCFSADGSLLYVGFSNNPDRRLKQHKADSRWFRLVAETRREDFAVKSEALAAERTAIRQERPIWNAKGNPARDETLLARPIPARAPTCHLSDAPNIVNRAIFLITKSRIAQKAHRQKEAEIFREAKAAGFQMKAMRKLLIDRKNGVLMPDNQALMDAYLQHVSGQRREIA